MYFLVTGTVDLTAAKPKRMNAWHLAETTGGGAAVVTFRDGGSSGPIVFRVNLASGTSASQAYFPPDFLEFPGGGYVTVVSGTVVGSVDLL